MNWAWLSAPAVALLLLAAHFQRAGQWPLMLACVALVLLLGWPRAWVPRLVQAGLAFGAGVWLWTTIVLVQHRLAGHQGWLRLALILGAVMLFTASAALVFERPGLRRHFRRGPTA
jgi:hypothetical protein